MKNSFLLLFIIIGAFSCGSQDDSRLLLFNNTSFTLLQNEKVLNITAIEKDNFFSYFDEQAPRIPLYKCIKNSNIYTIYIALPYNTSIQDLSNTNLISCHQDTLAHVRDVAYNYRKYKCLNEYVSEYTILLDDNMVCLLTSTSSALIADSLFSFEAMKNRLVLKQSVKQLKNTSL